MRPEHGIRKRDPFRGRLVELLQDPEVCANLSRLHDEMFERFAPAVEGPTVRSDRGHHGRLVFGDARD